MYSMETAPRDREIFLRANFSPVDETVFTARGNTIMKGVSGW